MKKADIRCCGQWEYAHKRNGSRTYAAPLDFLVSGLITSLSPEYRLKSSSVNTAATNLTGKVLYQVMAGNIYFPRFRSRKTRER